MRPLFPPYILEVGGFVYDRGIFGDAGGLDVSRS